MEYETLRSEIYKLNEDELFYQKYYYARQQEYSLQKFLAKLDMDQVRRRNLLVPELPETIPSRFEDTFFFQPDSNTAILTQRHNRYSPPIIHDHTFFELIYVYDGKCRQTISQSKITLQTGDICIIPPGIKHSLYFDQMIGYTLMLVFGLLIRNYEKNAELPVFTQKTDVQRFALLQYIQDNFSTVTLEDIAARFSYTPEYTSKLIKTTTGKTFTQILQQIRIEKAQVMLQDTNLSVANIANQIGYENPEHFIRLFKKKIGMTPTAYRRIGYHI